MVQYHKPHRYKKRKPIYHYLFFRLTILILIFFSLLVYFLFFTEYFQIKTINLVNKNQISEKWFSQQDLLNSLWHKSENKILFFNTRSIFLFKTKQAEKEILSQFPSLAKIEIKQQLPDTLNVTVIPREEAARLCLTNDCYILDKDGIVFGVIKEDNTLLKIIDKQKETIQLGERAISQQELAGLFKIKNQLEQDLHILISEFVITPEKLTVITQAGWEIYFDLKGDLDWQLTKLKVVLQEKIPSDQRANLEYIELRFGNFANPKYRINQDSK